jgi:hypothetical protein
MIPYITIFLRKLPILLQIFSLIFIVKILIDLKKKTNKHPRFTIKFNANLETASRQLFGTHGHFVYTALNNVRAYLFHFSVNSLPQIFYIVWSIKINFQF